MEGSPLPDTGPGSQERGPNPNRIPWNQRDINSNSPENPRRGVGELLNSVPLSGAFSNLMERFSGRKPNLTEMAILTKRTAQNLGEKRVFGQKLSDMLGDAIAGAVVSQASKTAVRIAFSASGVGITQMAILGAVGGGSSAVVKEYMRQRRSYNETTYQANLLSEIKHKLKIQDGRAIAIAGCRGIAMGAAGAVVANTVIGTIAEVFSNNEWIQTHVVATTKKAGNAVWGSISDTIESAKEVKLPELKIPEIKTPEIKLPQVSEEVNQVQENFGETPQSAKSISFPETPTAPTSPPAETLVPTTPGESLDPSPPKPSAPQLDTGTAPDSAPKPQWDGETPVSPENANTLESLQPPDQLSSDIKAPSPQTTPPGVVGETLSQPDIPTSLQEALDKLPPSIPLEAGSNPWNTTSDYLEQVLGRKPTPAEIMAVTKELCKSSNIAVPEWSISGEFSHTKLPIGFMLNFDDNVRNAVLIIAAGK